MKLDLAGIKGWLVDLNGVLYVGDHRVEGALEGLEWLRKSGIPCRFATNTTTRSARSMADKLHRFGFDIRADELVTAPQAGVHWLRTHAIRRCHFLLADELRKSEFHEFADADPGQSGAVVIGDIGDSWTYQLMDTAFRHLRKGARLLALHRTRYSQSEDGLRLDIGAIVAGLEYASGQEAVVAGKPSPTFFQRALAELGCAAEEAVMIGDDIDGDIGGARRAGLKTILTRTGKFREELVARSRIVPDLVLPSLALLPAAFGPHTPRG